jgi:hypothetical protein
MESQIGPLRKRQRERYGWDESSLQEQIVFDDSLSHLEDIGGQGSLFAPGAPPAPDSVCCGDGTQCQSFRKRGAVFNLSFYFPFDELCSRLQLSDGQRWTQRIAVA